MALCDHSDHRTGAVAPAASTLAHITWSDGTATLRHLCPGHGSEFRTLLARGATAFGRIRSVDFRRAV